MKQILFATIFIALSFVSCAQKQQKEIATTPKEDTTSLDINRMFIECEFYPQYPGGEAELMRYVYDNLRYPEKAKENNIQGRVVVQFVITKTGDIEDIKVVRSKSPELDQGAIRIIKSIPNKFIPGKINGKDADWRYTLPITFKL